MKANAATTGNPTKPCRKAAAGQDIATPNTNGHSTPLWLFDWMENQVQTLTGGGFQLDAAASDWNTKCPDYFDEEMDSLSQDWTQYKTIFCNPPFQKNLLGKFVHKAIDAADKGSTVGMILPYCASNDWLQPLKQKSLMHDVVGTIQFGKYDGTKVSLNGGHLNAPIAIAFLGPHIVGGTSGDPIVKLESTDQQVPESSSLVRQSPSRRQRKWSALSEIKSVDTEWLWHQRIPLGELTIIDGDPGDNKSSMLLSLAASVSTGRPMPDGTEGVHGGVLLLLGEDSIAKTVRRRLEVAEADLDRIVVPKQQVLLPGDLRQIEETVSRVSAKLVIIDPLMAFLSVNSNSDQKVRQILTPLYKMAERTNVAIVLVRHLNKSGGRNSLYRGGGSIGIIAATRSGFLVARPPDDPDLRVLCHTKSNLGPLSPSLLFEPVNNAGLPEIEWRGECDYTAEDLLSPSPTKKCRLAEAMSFLKEILEESPGEQGDIKRLAMVAGLAWRTVERAKEILDIQSHREGFGPGSKCFWSLPLGEESTYTAKPLGVAVYEPSPTLSN